MKDLVRHKERSTMRPMRLAAWAVAVAAAVAGAAGIVAGRGNAASANNAHEASYPPGQAKFKHPKLKHGLLTIEGTEASDKVALRLQAGAPGILEVDVGDDGSAEFSFGRVHVAKIAVAARAGDDLVRIDEGNGVAGGQGVETLLGGDGNDSIDGNGGADTAFMGAGDDTFVWDPGDGSDVVEGQDGTDTMLFNGAGVAEQVDLAANGQRLRFFRTQGTITMDTAGVETVDFNALGGADLATINDLSGTDVSTVNIDLASTLGGATGDAQPDRIVVNATNGNDTINISGDAGGVKVGGLAATIGILHSEAATDRLEINTLAGTDSVDSGGLAAGAIQLFVDGGLIP
jgi:Ca2+-binding RTX toxin-like protein